MPDKRHLQPGKIREAIKALERAYAAAQASQEYPHGRVLPCETQQKAARAEMECAEKLLSEAWYD